MKILMEIGEELIIFSLICKILASYQLKLFAFEADVEIFCQQPAINVLREIGVFLEANPSDIVTVIIEDYVRSPNGLTKVFDAAGLRKFWFPVSRMPKNGGEWPTVDDMVQRNQRLVVFTSKSAKEPSEGIAYEWRYLVENQCEFIFSLSLKQMRALFLIFSTKFFGRKN